MTILTQAEFSRQAGVSRQAVYWAVKNGVLLLSKDKKIDTAKDLNRAYLERAMFARKAQNIHDKPDERLPPGKQARPKAPIDEQKKAIDLLAKKDRLLKQRGELLPKKMVVRVLGRAVEYFHQCIERYNNEPIVVEIARGAANLMQEELDEIKRYTP